MQNPDYVVRISFHNYKIQCILHGKHQAGLHSADRWENSSKKTLVAIPTLLTDILGYLSCRRQFVPGGRGYWYDRWSNCWIHTTCTIRSRSSEPAEWHLHFLRIHRTQIKPLMTTAAATYRCWYEHIERVTWNIGLLCKRSAYQTLCLIHSLRFLVLNVLSWTAVL